MDYIEAPWGKRGISLYMAFLYRQETDWERFVYVQSTWRVGFLLC